MIRSLLTGQKPFKADNDYATFFKIAHEAPRSIASYRPDTPESLQRIVMRALEKNPANRYRTGSQLARDLSESFEHLKSVEETIDSSEKLEALKKIEFFKNFAANELAEVLKSTQWLKCEADEVIISEGDIEDCFYIIVAGEVSVIKQGKQIAALRPGDCFGEMAYLGAQKRTATIVASGDTVVMKINTAFIDQTSLGTQLRFYKVFSHTLIHRLSRTSELLSRKPQ